MSSDLLKYKLYTELSDDIPIGIKDTLSYFACNFNNLLEELRSATRSVYCGESSQLPTDTYFMVNAYKDLSDTWRQINSGKASWALSFDTTTNKLYIYSCAAGTNPLVWETKMSIDASSGLILPGGLTVDNITVTSFTTAGFVKNDASGILSGGHSIDALTWVEITGATSGVTGYGYCTNDVAQITVTLPATADQFSVMGIMGKGAGGWKIAQNAGQQIFHLDQSTTAGAGGYIIPEHYMAGLTLQCITTNTTWRVVSPDGNLILV